jgi:hypothetical protein
MDGSLFPRARAIERQLRMVAKRHERKRRALPAALSLA